ncbi:hypothetical protein [Candidatus Nitrosocosmicus sp. T]
MKIANNTFILLFSTFMVITPIGIQLSYSQSQELSKEEIQPRSTNVAENLVMSDSQTLLLEDRTLPEGNYLHLYDSSPYNIMNSHITAKIPCNEDFTTPIIFLIGPDNPMPIVGLALSPLLSQAGGLCMYTGDILVNNSTSITDIAIYNNSTEDIVFPSTSTIHIRVNEVAPQLNNTIQ